MNRIANLKRTLVTEQSQQDEELLRRGDYSYRVMRPHHKEAALALLMRDHVSGLPANIGYERLHPTHTYDCAAYWDAFIHEFSTNGLTVVCIDTNTNELVAIGGGLDKIVANRNFSLMPKN
jgi:hypothetical protein